MHNLQFSLDECEFQYLCVGQIKAGKLLTIACWLCKSNSPVLSVKHSIIANHCISSNDCPCTSRTQKNAIVLSRPGPRDLGLWVHSKRMKDIAQSILMWLSSGNGCHGHSVHAWLMFCVCLHTLASVCGITIFPSVAPSYLLVLSW